MRPARTGRHTPVGHAASSPVRGDESFEPTTGTPLASSSRIPSVLQPSSNGVEPLIDPNPIDNSTSSAAPPAKRPRGRPRKLEEPFGGELMDLDPKREPDSEAIISTLRDQGATSPFVRPQPVIAYLAKTTKN